MPGPALGNAFVYGTLMAPEVTQALLSRVPAAKPARLEGFRRHALQGLVFPAIVPDPQGSVQGLVLMDLTEREQDILDKYESVEYYRTSVAPVLEEDGSAVDAQVYVWKAEFRHLVRPDAWDYEAFLREELKSYMEMVVEFVAEELGPQ